MRSNYLKYITLFTAAILLSCSTSVFAAGEAPQSAPSSTTVVAPEGLTNRESHELEQQYRYTFRNKTNILTPTYSSSAAGFGGGAMLDESETREQTEQEKLYRYYGIAMNLAEECKYAEAIEILKYISSRRPKDQYVKSALRQMCAEEKAYNNRWQVSQKRDANILKTSRIKDLTIDGIAFYNQKRYDDALLNFSEILSMDPCNKKAQQYMEKLKCYYSQENKVAKIVKAYDARQSGDLSAASDADLSPAEMKVKNAAEKLLNQQESGKNGNLLMKNGKPASAVNAANKLLDKNEMQSLVEKKKAESAMDEAELGQTVMSIVETRKEEERKKSQLAIGSGDTISVIVQDHPELSGKVLVTYSGEAVLPLVNDSVMLKGLTVKEAAEKITTLMNKYVREPDVTVVIEEYKSKMFYVIDDIGCTPYPITRPNMTLRDALFLSDWGTNRALGRVVLMKPHKTHPIVKKVDAFDIIYRGNLAGNVRIDDGDVIYAPMTIVGKTTQVVNDTTSPVAALQNARNLWLQGKWTEKGLKSMFRIYPDTQELPNNVGQ